MDGVQWSLMQSLPTASQSACSKKRGKRADIKARLNKLGPKAVPVPSLLLAYVHSQENKMDQIDSGLLSNEKSRFHRDVATSQHQGSSSFTGSADTVQCWQNTGLCYEDRKQVQLWKMHLRNIMRSSAVPWQNDHMEFLLLLITNQTKLKTVSPKFYQHAT